VIRKTPGRWGLGRGITEGGEADEHQGRRAGLQQRALLQARL